VKLFSRLAALAVLAGVIGVGVTSSAAGAGTNGPPNGVYTCSWISAHPLEAAQAGVGCSSTPPLIVNGMVAPTFVAPRAAAGLAQPLSNEVCQRLPSSGQVGHGVFAWTPSYYYSNEWNINGYVAYNYTWYIQKTDGTNVYSQLVTDGAIHDSGIIGANNYRGGAQNHTTSNVYWTICYVNPG
jgi:hypothetical protein